MSSISKAQAARNLSNDPTFLEIMDDVRREQSDIFLDPSSSMEELEEAHAIVRALGAIEGSIQRKLNRLTVAQHIADRTP